MSDFEQFIPAHVRALDVYSPGKPVRQAARETGRQSLIKLASNENPFGPSPRALEAMRKAAAQSNFYPDNDAVELRQCLAELHKIRHEQILVTAGSTQFLDIISRTLLAPGLNAVTSERSFIVYRLAVRAAGGEFIEVPMQNNAFDLEAILRAINDKTRIVFLANPNNPTGTMFDAAATENFLRRAPEHVLVVLDEAYCDFAEVFAQERKIIYSRSLDLVRAGRNLIVLRTFSKSHGLAGIRVGYGLGPAKLIHHFAKIRPAFSISNVAEAGALAAVDDREHVQKAVENNRTQSQWLLAQLHELDFNAVPTSTNFIYFDTGEDAADLARRIETMGVIVRPLTLWGAPKSIRVTIGTPEQNRQFVEALNQSTGRAAAKSVVSK